MSSKLATELYKTALWQDADAVTAIVQVDEDLDEVRSVLESFRLRDVCKSPDSDCWCLGGDIHTARCKAAQELFEKLRKDS